MDALQKESIIPEQVEGAYSDTTAVHSCSTEEEACSLFQIAKKRLMNVNAWESIAGLTSADFRLCNDKGDEVDREVRLYDHFKIDIPGPGPATGDGYDWVQVKEIEEKSTAESEIVAITVRPVPHPKNEKNDVAHFFSNSATSSFIVERQKNFVTASVHGRNEKPNTNAENLIDKARNTAMATAAITAFSKLQWQGLVDGLLKEGANG